MLQLTSSWIDPGTIIIAYALPDSVKQSLSVDSFKSCLKTYLFTLSDSEVASLF